LGKDGEGRGRRRKEYNSPSGSKAYGKAMKESMVLPKKSVVHKKRKNTITKFFWETMDVDSKKVTSSQTAVVVQENPKRMKVQ
jgi:hypothetical protein